MIHETADAAAAERYWSGLLGVEPSTFNKTTLKRHNPRTNRKNVSDGYRGCLVIQILGSADLYRRIEGAWCGIVGAVRTPHREFGHRWRTIPDRLRAGQMVLVH